MSRELQNRVVPTMPESTVIIHTICTAICLQLTLFCRSPQATVSKTIRCNTFNFSNGYMYFTTILSIYRKHMLSAS